jgi:NAD(P)-dependent dehydrogenase (short-subunit alcohol dehydrogenase family)
LESKYHIQTVRIQAGIGSESDPVHLIHSAEKAFRNSKLPGGTFHIDIVVNNAGTAAIINPEDCDIESFNRMYNLNSRGPMLLLKAALPYLPHYRSGRIINVSRIASSVGLEGQTIYGGTKAALEAMTRTWWGELAERATVNAINPGKNSSVSPVMTLSGRDEDMTPLGGQGALYQERRLVRSKNMSSKS